MQEETKRGPGRPRKAPKDLRRQVTLKLSQREHEAAKAKAAEIGLSFAAYVRSRIL